MREFPVAIAMGSNQGDRLGFLSEAWIVLQEDVLLDPRCASIYETPPWGKTDQPDFLNTVVCGFTTWKPPALMNYLKNLETKLGRKATSLWGPREIDLDLILFGEETWNLPEVQVPHPHALEREFVLKPLAEVCGNWIFPGTSKTVAQLWSHFQETQPLVSKTFSAPLPNKAIR